METQDSSWPAKLVWKVKGAGTDVRQGLPAERPPLRLEECSVVERLPSVCKALVCSPAPQSEASFSLPVAWLESH